MIWKVSEIIESQDALALNKPVLNSSLDCVLDFSVHLRMEEKIILTAGREGGLQNLEVHGIVTLKLSSDKVARIKVALRNNDTKGAQVQV